MKLDNIKKIIAEDFKEEDRDLIARLGSILNKFMDDVYNLSNNRINFDNLSQEVVTIRATVDASGIPTTSLKFSSNKVNRAQGGVVINYKNLSNSINYPTSMPGISFVPVSTNLYKINHIIGLQANEKYELKILIFS